MQEKWQKANFFPPEQGGELKPMSDRAPPERGETIRESLRKALMPGRSAHTAGRRIDAEWPDVIVHPGR
jgi:hypothetical protein